MAQNQNKTSSYFIITFDGLKIINKNNSSIKSVVTRYIFFYLLLSDINNDNTLFMYRALQDNGRD